MDQGLSEVETRARAALDAAANAADPPAAFEAWRVHFLSGHGEVTQLLRTIGKRPPEERKAFGRAVQGMHARLDSAYQAMIAASQASELQQRLLAESIDVTLPGRTVSPGVQHPMTRALDDTLAAFANIGFQAVEGPEVEWEFFNFQALNIPKDHPARDMWDTLWIDDERLLRTHTSPMQVRTMLARKPPLRIVVPGRAYRYESIDATHESQFTQIEGLLVDARSTFSDLKGVLTDFARQLFGATRRTRFRCDYFPFVEPGAEMAIDCFVCEGRDPHCRICHGTGWLEILGAGMVHPRVLEYGGIDSALYSGFAFGMGLERIAMLRYGIEDIRLFYQNDLRVFQQVRAPLATAPVWDRQAPR